MGHGGSTQLVQAGAEVGQPFAQAFGLARVADVRGAGDGVGDAGVAMEGVRQVGAGGAAEPARRVRLQQVGGGHQGDEAVFGAVEQIEQLLGAGAPRRARILHLADAHARRFQRGPQCAALGPGDRAPGLRTGGRRQARIHAGQRVGEIGQAAITVRDRVGRVLPGTAAPHQRGHQDRPQRAGHEEQRVRQAGGKRGRGQFSRHHEAGRQQGADNGGRRPKHAQQAAEGAAGEGQGQQQPQMTGAGAGQEAEQRPDQAQRQHRAGALAQGSARIAEAGPERGDGGPAQPRLVREHGQDHGRGADGGGLQGIQPEDVAQRKAPTG
ncbi:Uncharacterised protein [Achromobacter xylosoxidans]|nr:Uncharacterised protein [Achromobacter xylosoxidans]